MKINNRRSEEIVKAAGMGRRAGLGERPALLIVDMQVYMLGDKREPLEQSISAYPSSCGLLAWEATEHIKTLSAFFREKGLPVIYTQQSLKPDGSDAGPYKTKRGFRYGADNWLIEGTHGWQIAPAIAPRDGDLIIKKTRPSAFFRTNLLRILQEREVDTLVITGGSTSTCIRATVFDSASYDFRTIVVSDGICDRLEESHRVNLSDMDRQMADAMREAEVIAALKK